MKPIRRLDPCDTCCLIKAIAKRFFGVVFLFELLRPYELGPRKPDQEPPKDAGDITDAQFALCQSIFDHSEARGIHIEQKAQWTFTVIAFLMPVLVFLVRDPAIRVGDNSLSLAFLTVSALLLFISFISALRAMAIRSREILYLDAVINKMDGTFLEYKIETHAQGLLYCAAMNHAMNDHIAQFVKGAHLSLAFAVISFTMGVGVTSFQMAA